MIPPALCLPRHCGAPVPYALCSDEESRLGPTRKDFISRFRPAGEIPHHYYTLRLLQPEIFLYGTERGKRISSSLEHFVFEKVKCVTAAQLHPTETRRKIAFFLRVTDHMVWVAKRFKLKEL